MPVKILLADKSITIQKVVEMLFSGKEYEVTCVSDGDAALGEVSRVKPNVILADVDLPRVDGYRFAAKLKEHPVLGAIPVILMLSRDDQYDAGRGKQAGIIDSIAKPFESQELIGKVKKALVAALVPGPAVKQGTAPPPPAVEKPAPTPKPVRPAAVESAPAASPRPAAPEAAPKPAAKQSVPPDILDILEEAPVKPEQERMPQAAPQTPRRTEPIEEEVFEVEPEIEVEPEMERSPAAAAPVKSAAVLAAEPQAVEWKPPIEEPMPVLEPVRSPDTDDFGTEQLFGEEPKADTPRKTDIPSDHASPSSPVEHLAAGGAFDFSEQLPTEAEEALPLGAKAMEEMREGLGIGDELTADEPFRASGGPSEIVSFESLDVASRVSHEEYAPVPSGQKPAAAEPVRAAEPLEAFSAAPLPAPALPAGPVPVTDEMLRIAVTEAVEKMAKELIERVAWEVIPGLAEQMIRAEIERLSSEV